MANINTITSTNYARTSNRNYFRLAWFATILALIVVMLGAYTRLDDAGLGCPDWPGCYGQLTAPHTSQQIQQAEQAFPGQAIQTSKAWTEMVHRYVAGTLGIIILILALWAFGRRMKGHMNQPVFIPLLLLLVVLFQAVLGMWTVTWKVLPLIVTSHLMGGMIIAALLWALTLKTGGFTQTSSVPLNRYRPWAILGLIIVIGQIFLGAWTSTHYASIICPNFPFCQGSLFPHMNFAAAFNFFAPIGVDYQGGVLNTVARVTIQMTHRYGAFITAVYIGILALSLIFSRSEAKLRTIGWAILITLALQFCLGIANVVMQLPMSIAVAHNGVAALLLLSIVTLLSKLYNPRPRMR